MPLQVGSFLTLLEPADRERFEAYAREPNRKIDQLMTWLCADGGLFDSRKVPADHPRRVARTNVWRWFRQWKETDKLRIACEIADALHTTSAEVGTPDLASAINLQVAQRLQDQLMRIKNPDVTALSKMALTLNRVASSQQRIVELKRVGREQLAELKGEAKKRTLTPEDIERVSKAVFG